MCLGDPEGVDRPTLPPRHQQGGIRRWSSRLISGAQNRQQENGHWYTVFVDSASAIGRIRSDALGPGQSFGVASIEVYTRIRARDNEITIRWVPVHQGAEGNEKADELAKSVAEGGNPNGTIPDEYWWGTSPSHMTRVATETRNRTAAQWIARHVNLGRKYRPPSGKEVKREQLRRARKAVASRYY